MLLVFDLSGQVSTDFSANQLAGCSPLTVSFNDLSSGSPTTWLWDFGNTNTSTLQNPGAIFVNPGTYTITLTTSDGSSSDTEVKTTYITVFADPVSNFQANQTLIGCAPFKVNFTDLSVPGNGTINTWLWDFGDGTNSSLANPSHLFTNPGAYTITLFVTDNNGCQDGFSIPNYITVLDTPIATFSAFPLSACNPPISVSFTNNSTGNSPLTFDWLFGDGGSGITPSPTHLYQNSGIFDVSLVATDQNGCKDTLVIPNYIHLTSFTAGFNGSPTSGCSGTTINFTDASGNGVNSWIWDFGDGSSGSTLQNPSHTYQNPGTYTVTLNSSSGVNCNAQSVKSGFITILPGPGVGFTIDSMTNCSLPFTVNFADTIGTGISWLWNFGDGTSSTLQNPSHTYTNPGNYFVSLKVTSANGCSDSLIFPDSISIQPPNALFPFSITSPTHKGCIPLEVDFFDQSFSAEPIVSWFWTFGDGNTSILQNPTHIYTTSGAYDVSLIIVNNVGCTDTFSIANHVTAGDTPIVNFVAVPTISCKSDVVSFDNLSTGNKWNWDFGDNTSSTVQFPFHLFPDTGCYTITLTAEDYGCEADTVFEDYVCILGPIALFQPDKSVLCKTPGIINFTDLSKLAETWTWNFDNGQTDTIQNPSTTFTSPGIYGVTLVVTNDSIGCNDSITFPILVSGVEANFGSYPSYGCDTVLVTYVDSSVQAAWWRWSFGNGNDTILFNPWPILQNNFTEPGYYNDTLYVMDSWGCTDTIVKLKNVLVMGPDIDFWAADTFACQTLTTQFSTTIGTVVPITSWLWNFGDNTTSSLPNPSHTFSPSINQYTVTLTVIDSGGCSTTLIRPDYISVSEPIPDFIPNTFHSCPNYPVSFTNISTGMGLNYFWDFGDGDTTSVKNPNHTYSIPGVYNVSLSISDLNGCDSTMVKMIVVDTLTAHFGGSPISAPCPPLLTSFSDSSTSYITSWQWDFGDGSVSVLPNPSHLYASAGIFDVSLIVQNVQGCTDTVLFSQLINVGGPAGSFTFNPSVGCSPLEVQFQANANNVAFYAWDMGDGTIISNLVDTAQHIYNQAGTFHPILIIDDGQGCSVSLISPDSVVVDTSPVAMFSVNNPLVCSSLGLVVFTDNSVSGSPVSSWLWDFGDGQTDTVQNPAHLYQGTGTYDVTLVVSNSSNCSDTLLIPDFVKLVLPPVPAAQILDTISICQPYVLEFSDLSQVFDPLASWNWKFGDGTLSSSQNPTHSYANPGNYSIQLLVTDTNGCLDSTNLNFIAPVIPHAWFNLADSVSCGSPFTVNFTANSLDFVNWNWDFDDGNNGSGNIVSHTYQNFGHFSPTLFTEDIYGCLDTLRRFQPVFSDSLSANFSWNVLPGCAPIQVVFTDLSYSDTSLSLWIWKFGDGSGAFSQHPIHAYSSEGVHLVEMIVQTVLGCRDTILLPGPDIIFPPTPTTTQFDQISVESDQSISLNWSPYSGPLFSHYVIYREMPIGSGQFIAIDSLSSISSTFYLDQNGIDPLHNVYCYRIQVVDSCGLRSDLNDSRTHCSVELKANPDIMKVNLTWNAYLGWDSVTAYEIYRVMDYLPGNSTLLAMVPGDIYNYTDSNFICFEHTCYRIRALNGNGQTSWSDTSCAIPIDTVILPEAEMIHATVENNADVRLDWLPPIDPSMVAMEIDRSIDLLNWQQIGQVPIMNLTFLDVNANVHQRDYYYQLISIDSCEKPSPESNLSRSIFLQATLDGIVPELNWNPYSEWSNAVLAYKIEILNDQSQTWEFLAQVPGNVHFYRDENTDFNQPNYCYRVRAIERQGNQSFSLSNQACVPADAQIWAPNVFTPNQDGIHDLFLMNEKNIVEFELNIFTRWGQLIFTSYDVHQGWDGKFAGREAAESVYYYVATATGAHGKKFSLQGHLTLLR